MVTTWLDQNKAFWQALFSAELIYLKQLRAKAVFNNLGTVFFSVWGGKVKNLVRPVYLVPFFFVIKEFTVRDDNHSWNY